MSDSALDQKNSQDETIPFYPDHVRSEVQVVIGLTALVMIVGLFGLMLPVGVGEPADPLNTPAHVKPEWYFLALYQVLKFIPKTTGVMLPLIGVTLVMLWPFIDHKPEKLKGASRIRLIAVIIGLLVAIALTIWGEVS
jgi:quinol-cytochrome oxidoreductase complex cytochrome b subunit